MYLLNIAIIFAGRNFREVKKSRNIANLSFAKYDFSRNFTGKTFAIFRFNFVPGRGIREKGSISQKYLPTKVSARVGTFFNDNESFFR